MQACLKICFENIQNLPWRNGHGRTATPRAWISQSVIHNPTGSVKGEGSIDFESQTRAPQVSRAGNETEEGSCLSQRQETEQGGTVCMSMGTKQGNEVAQPVQE